MALVFLFFLGLPRHSKQVDWWSSHQQTGANEAMRLAGSPGEFNVSQASATGRNKQLFRGFFFGIFAFFFVKIRRPNNGLQARFVPWLK
jgi:hypothetical protein